MAYYRSGTQKPLEAGNGIDITDETISLKQASTTEFGAAKIDGTSISVNASGQIKKLKTQTVTLSANTSEITAGSTDVITATASAGGTLSVSSSDSSVATASVSNREVTITGVGEGNCVITVTASATGDYGVGTATIDTTVTVVSIYGAEWDGSSSPAWTRTDGAVGFADPNPYYSGMSGSPSSPFDNIMPWSGMRIVEDSVAGTLVEIPKFYYKWTRNGSAMKLQISMNQEDGFLCSPAHADRGDGIGERDYAYIGRYHWGDTVCKSASGQKPKTEVTRGYARINIHNLGLNVWQNDYAMRWTVNMLYLVEFANWNSQLKIGYGCGDQSSTGTMGYTNNMSYHTGTTQASRTTYGLGTQYRYIEGWWDNVCDWVDGIYFNSTSIYGIKNPADFSDTSGGTNLGTRTAASGYIREWTNPSVSGFEYAIYPNDVNSSLDGTTYIGDFCSYSWSGVVLCTGGNFYIQDQGFGAFYFDGYAATSKSTSVGSRLMVLPPSRLTT